MSAALALTNIGTDAQTGELTAEIGVSPVISGTGWALTHAITITISSPEEGERVQENLVSDGAGAWSSANASGFVWTPEVDGVWTVTVTDGTSTLVDKIRIFAP